MLRVPLRQLIARLLKFEGVNPCPLKLTILQIRRRTCCHSIMLGSIKDPLTVHAHVFKINTPVTALCSSYCPPWCLSRHLSVRELNPCPKTPSSLWRTTASRVWAALVDFSLGARNANPLHQHTRYPRNHIHAGSTRNQGLQGSQRERGHQGSGVGVAEAQFGFCVPVTGCVHSLHLLA